MQKLMIVASAVALALSAVPAHANCVVLQNYSSCFDAQGNQTVVNHIGGYPGGMTMVTSNNTRTGPTSSTTLAFGQTPVVYGNGYGSGYGGAYGNSYGGGAWAQPTLAAGSTTTSCAGAGCR